MCCSAACAFQPVAPSLNQNSSSAHPLLPCCRPIIKHYHPTWHPRRGPQAVLSRFSTNPGWSHRPELQLSTFPTCTHAPVPAYQPPPQTPATTTATAATKETCATGTPAATDAARKPAHHGSPAQQFRFPTASRSTSTSHLGKS